LGSKELGMRKIPDPMMVPTTIATASKRFNSFRKVGEQAAASPLSDTRISF